MGERRPPGPSAAGQSPTAVAAEVTRALAAVPFGAVVVVAASGGPDSSALALLTAAVRPDLGLVIGHVRHGLRDDRADFEAVGALAQRVGAPLEVEAVTVAATGEGLEAAARHARYGALWALVDRRGAARLLVGHTADDQAETVLLRIARGTGIDGLGGMAAADGQLVRPLLRLRRADVRAYLDATGFVPADDPTNRDLAHARNRVRHELLPAFARIGADPVGALARLADLARDDAAWLDEAARVVPLRAYGAARCVRDDELAALPVVLARRVVRRLLAELRGDPFGVSARHVDDVLGLQPGDAYELGSVRVTRGGGWLAAAPHPGAPPVPLPLAIGGSVAWPLAGSWVSARSEHGQGIGVGAASVPPGGEPALADVSVAGATIADGLVVRARADGDRIVTRAGSRKLQDLLVDAGVPRVVRDLVPVVARAERGGGIVWVPGVAVDAEAAAATPGDRGRIRLTVEPL